MRMFNVEVGVELAFCPQMPVQVSASYARLEAVAELGRPSMVAAMPLPSLTCKDADE
jgi:hypothetical protein